MLLASLAAGTRRPYDRWLFVIVPDEVVEAFGSKRPRVRCRIRGVAFAGSVSRGEGVYRLPVPRMVRESARLAAGDRVRVALELDPEPEAVAIPAELRAILKADSALARAFAGLPPSHRRAWAAHVGEAKRPETRLRRAAKARDGIRGRKFPGA